jgi:hypothetical protein
MAKYCIFWHVDPLLGNDSVNTFSRQRIRRQQLDNFRCYTMRCKYNIGNAVFMSFVYILCCEMDMFSMDPPRDYVSSTEQNQMSRTTRTKMGRVLGSRGRRVHLKIDCELLVLIVRVIKRDCTKKVLINQSSDPKLIINQRAINSWQYKISLRILILPNVSWLSSLKELATDVTCY